MSELNYLRVAQLLGGTLSEVQPPVFGPISAPAVSAERFRLITRPTPTAQKFDPRELRLIAEAFEEVRAGFEPDRVLVDPKLSKQFIAAVRRRGVTAPEPLINKRLQAIRKAPAYGIKLEKTTREPELDPEPYFYAAEFGYAQLSYHQKASVDDVITNPEVGAEFVHLCKQIEPRGSGMEFKWAALRLRKMRSFSKPKLEKLRAYRAEEIEQSLRFVGTLDHLAAKDVPEQRGLFTLAEQNGQSLYLYVGATQNRTLREAVEPFRSAKPFLAVAGRDWQPTLANISLRVAEAPKKRILGASPRDLSLRLIEERHPLFNMPVRLMEEEMEAA